MSILQKSDECYKKDNKQGSRLPVYVTTIIIIIDGQWYRFQGDAGTRMPSACPDSGSCGAIMPWWLDGDLATVKDGEKIMEVFFSQI